MLCIHLLQYGTLKRNIKCLSPFAFRLSPFAFRLSPFAFRLSLIIILGFITAGCSNSFFDKKEYQREKGAAWCKEPYLPYKYSSRNSLAEADHKKKVELSYQGYLYAVAGAYVLQEHNKRQYEQCQSQCQNDSACKKCEHKYKEFDLELPSRMQKLDSFTTELKPSGFAAMTFVLYDNSYKENSPTNKVEAIIIAFEGSNDAKDWTLNNLFPFYPIQLDEARLYAKMVSQNEAIKKLRNNHPTNNAKLVVSGFSMAGAMAAHVKRHWEMKDKDGKDIVDEAWAFNSSPRVGSTTEHLGSIKWDKRDNIYLLANQYEFLQLAFWRNWSIGAKPENTMTKFALIKSWPFYAHSRWVLTRQILHYADLYLYYQNKSNSYRLDYKDINEADKSEPMRILASQEISASKACYNQAIERLKQKWLKNQSNPSADQ